jgi:hypothetical protein
MSKIDNSNDSNNDNNDDTFVPNMHVINVLQSAQLLRAAASMTEAAQVNANNTAEYLRTLSPPEHLNMAQTLAASQNVFAVACGAAVAALNHAANSMSLVLGMEEDDEDEEAEEDEDKEAEDVEMGQENDL